jgi:hypothetical protein
MARPWAHVGWDAGSGAGGSSAERLRWVTLFVPGARSLTGFRGQARGAGGGCGRVGLSTVRAVVISGPFFKNLLHNHFITDFLLKNKSGEAEDSIIFPFCFLLHKRANPILPPYLLPHLRARTQTLYSPLTFSLRPPIHPYILPPPMASRFEQKNSLQHKVVTTKPTRVNL